MTLEQVTEFFKWMTILNVGLLVLTTVLVMILKNVICKMHGKMFGIKPEHFPPILYGYLGVYKILVIVFNLVPYLALVIIG